MFLNNPTNRKSKMNYFDIFILRSIGVVTYALLSGLSPFLDDSQEETCSNIIRVDYSFPDEFFGIISKEAQTFILDILVEDIE